MPLLGIYAASVQKASTAFESIASTTLSNNTTSTVTFSSISGSYQHLQLRIMARGNAASYAYVRLNSDSGTNYTNHQLNGNGTDASSTGGTSSNEGLNFLSSATNSTIYGVTIIDIHDYASTTKNKTMRAFTGRDYNGSGVVTLGSSLWLNTNAVTSISILGDSTFGSGSIFSLYGIKA